MMGIRDGTVVSPYPTEHSVPPCAPGHDAGPGRFEGSWWRSPSRAGNLELCQFSEMVIWNRSATRAFLLNVDYLFQSPVFPDLLQSLRLAVPVGWFREGRESNLRC